MDNVTHSLFALTLAQTPLRRAGSGATAVLVLASNAPDIDVVTTARGSLAYLEWHRGPTHGPLGIVGLGLVAAVLVWAVCRWRVSASNGEVSLLRLSLLAILGAASHVAMDLPTSYGTRALSPFDWHWFATDWMPIVDIYLLAILAACLAFGRWSRRPRARGRNAGLALAVMVAFYGVRGTAHQQAVNAAPAAFGPLLPGACRADLSSGGTRQASDASPFRGAAEKIPFDHWPRQAAVVPGSEVRCLVEVAAFPTFFSPFHWRLLAHMSNSYEVRDVNLLNPHLRAQPDGASRRDGSWRLAVTFPNRWTPPVFVAARTRTAGVFLGFSRFPAARVWSSRDGTSTVQWIDLRFLTDLSRAPRSPRSGLFTATVRLRAAGVIDERLGP